MKKISDHLNVDEHCEGEQNYYIESIIFDPGSEYCQSFKNKGLILEYKEYKDFGKTMCTYRIDIGNGEPGRQTHIHVYNKSGQLYAMNIDGTSHDGSKIHLSKTHQKILANLGFVVPDGGILEWWVIDQAKILLLD